MKSIKTDTQGLSEIDNSYNKPVSHYRKVLSC